MKVKYFLCFIFWITTLSAQDKLVLFFDFNQDIINEKSQEEFCNWLSFSKSKEIIKIQGFCDTVDSNTYNKELSLRRASNVLALLKYSKVAVSEKVEVYGFGEDFQQQKNQSENRKVVMYYQNKKDFFLEKANIVERPAIESEISVSEISNNTALEEKVSKAEVGDLIKLENLNFYFNSEKIMRESEPILSNLLQILKMNPQLKINIYGHICCNNDPNDVKLSYRRAKAIFDFLIRNGIATARLGYKGFGSSRPIYRLPEKNETERIANRRVEIQVIKK